MFEASDMNQMSQPVPRLLEQCGTLLLAPDGLNPTPKAQGSGSEKIQFAVLGST